MTSAKASTPSVLGSPLWLPAGSLQRFTLVLWIGAYTAIYYLTYVVFTSPEWAYFGAGFDPRWSGEDIALFVMLALLPALWLPIGVQRVSDLFILLQYLLIYIPALLLVRHSSIPVVSHEFGTLLSFSLFSGMTIMVCLRRSLPLLALPRPPIPPGLTWGIISCGLALSLCGLWVVLGGKFRLVGLFDVYSIRDEVTDILEGGGGGRWAGYAFAWANALFLPLLFARGCCNREPLPLLAVAGGYLFLFGVWAAKTSLFAPVYLCLFYILLGRKRPDVVPHVLCLGMMSLLLVPYVFGDPRSESALRTVWVAVVHLRVFTVPSLLVTQYADFFASHPLTYGSHITGINLLIPYPYDLDIPRTVGFQYYGAMVTSNVSFWAQDGIAGLGIGGIPVVSVLASLVLWIADSATAHLPLRFVGTAMCGVLINFLGSSLFTTLLTGGMLLMMLLLWAMPSRPSGSR